MIPFQVAALIAIGLITVGCGSREMDAPVSAPVSEMTVLSQSDPATNYYKPSLRKVAFEGHRYIQAFSFISTSSSGGYSIAMVHDPDCPCQKRK